MDASNGTKVTLRFRNAKPPLELLSEWWARPGRGPVRTATTIKNLSGKPLSLFYQPSVRLAATADGQVTVWYINTSPCKTIDPVGVYRDKLSENYVKNLATTMRDMGWIPFAALESSGGHGLYVGIEWRLALTRIAGPSDKTATLTAGVLVPGSGKRREPVPILFPILPGKDGHLYRGCAMVCSIDVNLVHIGALFGEIRPAQRGPHGKAQEHIRETAQRDGEDAEGSGEA